MPNLDRDFETNSTLDIRDVGARRYAADPTTNVLCVAYAVDDGPVQLWFPRSGGPIPEPFFEAERNPEWTVTAHNDGFESAIEELNLAPRYGWPLVPIERHRCTMAMALACALPAKLEKVAEALDLPVRKDAEGHRLMLQMAKPRKPRLGEDPNSGPYWHDEPEMLQRLGEYCKQDVEVERTLRKRLPQLTDAEQALWTLDAIINARGFYTDGPLLDAASRIAAAAGQATQAELTRITAGTLTSTDQVAALQAWLAEHGCEVKNIIKPTLRQALRRKGLDPDVRRVLELRLGAAHAAAAKIDTVRAWRNSDGRVRGSLRFHGAGTGRWTGHGPQPQNFKRDGEDLDGKRIAIATGELAHVASRYPQPLEAVGDIARAMIRAAPGHRLLAGDFSGVESRVTAYVSGQISKLNDWAKFDATGDPKLEPYYLLGRACNQSDETARSVGKTADLAFGYMGGVGAWDKLAPDDDASSEADKKRYQQTWRSLHPQTVAFWRNIDSAAIRAVRFPGKTFTVRQFSLAYDGSTFLQITLPSGRALRYPFPRLEPGKYDGLVVVFKDGAGGKWADCRFGQGAYGGLWTENIVQAISRDLLAAAMQRLEAAGYPVVLHVHDEVVCEVPNGFGSPEEFQRLLTAVPDWAAGFPIAAKVRNGQRFAKSSPPKPVAEPGTLPAAEPRDALEEILGDDEIDAAEADDAINAHAGAVVALCAECGMPLEADRVDAHDGYVHPQCYKAFEARRLREQGIAPDTRGNGRTDPAPSSGSNGNGAAPAGESVDDDDDDVGLGNPPHVRDDGLAAGGLTQAQIEGLRAFQAMVSQQLAGGGTVDAPETPQGNGAGGPRPSRGNGGDDGGRLNGGGRGSKDEAEQDSHGEEHAGKPFNDAYLLVQGYRLARVFDYALPDGTLLYQQNRYELLPGVAETLKRPRKRFLPHRSVNGQEVFGAGKRHILYHWPAVMRAGPGATVFATEGEANADALIKAGLLATTVLSHDWSPECVAALTGYHVIIPEDADKDGAKLAANARAKLLPVAASVRVVPASHLWRYLKPPRDPQLHDDIEDWLKLGSEPAKLLEICREIPAEGFITAGPYTLQREESIPAWQWLYGRHLLRGEVAGTAAMGGTGKSTLSIVEALAMVSGQPLLGLEVPAPLRVVLINLEDTRNTMDKRIAAAMRYYGSTAADIGDRLIVIAKGELKIKVARQLRSGDVERDEVVIKALTTLMVDHRADVLSIDSFIRTHRVNENDNSAVQEVVECFEDIATAAHCAVHLWHHTRKGGGERATIENARGAIAFVDACRSARILETMSAKEHADLMTVQSDLVPPGFYFRSFNGKRNFAPPADQSNWYLLTNVTLANGDAVGVATPWQYPATWAELSNELANRILDDIDTGLPNGQRYSGKNAAKPPRAVQEAVRRHCPNKTNEQCRQIIATWLRNGVLYEDKYHDPVDSKERTGLYVRAEKRPHS
jgi:DNA polymerase